MTTGDGLRARGGGERSPGIGRAEAPCGAACPRHESCTAQAAGAACRNATWVLDEQTSAPGAPRGPPPPLGLLGSSCHRRRSRVLLSCCPSSAAAVGHPEHPPPPAEPSGPRTDQRRGPTCSTTCSAGCVRPDTPRQVRPAAGNRRAGRRCPAVARPKQRRKRAAVVEAARVCAEHAGTCGS